MLSFAPALTYIDDQVTQSPSVSLSAYSDSDVHLDVTPYGQNSLQNIPSVVHTESHLQFTNTVSFTISNINIGISSCY